MERRERCCVVVGMVRVGTGWVEEGMVERGRGGGVCHVLAGLLLRLSPKFTKTSFSTYALSANIKFV